MDLINATRMAAAYTLGREPSGRESIVTVVKGTFALPKAGEEPRLADEQVPLVMADQFTGEPGFSAALYESEFAPFKARCDVLLNGSAYSPGGRPAERVPVALRVGPMTKSFIVVGDRYWSTGLTGFKPSAPQPFRSMPISYDRAWGGSHPSEKDPSRALACPDNPVGKGYYIGKDLKQIIGRPLPNTEDARDPISKLDGKHRPLAFGVLARNAPARTAFAGTYDERYLEEHFPFLPPDFDPRYYQSAPADQQIDYPRGGEEVELINLTPQGQTRFRLPSTDMPVEFMKTNLERTEVRAALDTILIEPDLGRFMTVWRASVPVKRDIFDVAQCVVGRMSKAWYRARETGKSYYASLSHACSASHEADEGE